jgi:hypothetical protein
MAMALYTRNILCTLWLLAVGAGTATMLNYQSTAGRFGETPPHWPSKSAVPLEPDRATLVMFAHPQCPCSRASVSELNRLLVQSHGRIAAHVMFLKPKELTEEWTRTDLWRSAAAIPGVTVHEDPDGAQAHRFGAETSGYVVLYDRHGELLFKGGITEGRGHAGDNAGATLIVSLLAAQDTNLRQTPVYGCSLVNEAGTSHAETTVCIK